MLGDRTGEAVTELMESMPQKREELQALLDGAGLALRDLLLLKKCESAPLCFYSDREEALGVSDLRPAGYILKIYENCLSAGDELLHNANVRLTATRLVCPGE